MLYNSYAFILLFLPVSLFVYFFLNSRKLTLASKLWLVTVSLLFYSWWNIIYLPILLGSILFNYIVGASLGRMVLSASSSRRKAVLAFGLVINLALLGYFKYADFFILNVNCFTNASLSPLQIVLPLGISFFTFTQIAYLVDSYRSTAYEYDFLNYSLFVTFFPHLLAGPIIHHGEMMPQFGYRRNKILNYRNLSVGIFLFMIGLFKKVAIADTVAVWADYGFDTAQTLTLIEGWITSISYTLQIYFDFSGYTDMALGCALMFNIRLPANFNSPYKALDIQDFWRRWHITLSRFLRDYIYIPLGGNRTSEHRILGNLFITFLIGGLWHGAGWTFVFWGALHGSAIVIHRIWKKVPLSLPKWLAWLITFNFVNLSWLFFRARSFSDAIKVLKAMVGFNIHELSSSIGLNKVIVHGLPFRLEAKVIIMLNIFLIFIALYYKNSNIMADNFKPDNKRLCFTAFIAIFGFLCLMKESQFIYFNF